MMRMIWWMVSLKVGDDEVFPEEVFKGRPDLSIPPAFCQSTQGGTPPCLSEGGFQVMVTISILLVVYC